MFSTRKVIILALVFSSLSWSAPAWGNHTGDDMISRIHRGAQRKHNTPAKGIALQWKHTGTTYYRNSGTAADSIWKFIARDTILYNAAGNAVDSMSSSAHSGWSKDSLATLDSTIYENGRCKGTVSMSFTNGSITGGYRDTYTYLNGGKSIVYTFNIWFNSKWTPAWKDSANYSAPVIMYDYWNPDYTGFLSRYMYSYDAISAWSSDGYYTLVDPECTSTTLVMSGKEMNGGSLEAYKKIMLFKSSDWSWDNIIEYRTQEKNPNGEYYDTEKYEYSENGSSNYSYKWDAASNTPVCTYAQKLKSAVFSDLYKNDTLTINFEYDTSANSWDTTSMFRSARRYDSNGNNIATVKSSYDLQDKIWRFIGKNENTFAKINVPVIHFEKVISAKKLSILQTSGFVRFFAPDITGLEIFTIEGRMVASVRQNSASSATLYLAGSNAKVPSGTYIVRLVCKNVVNSFPLLIKR